MNVKKRFAFLVACLTLWAGTAFASPLVDPTIDADIHALFRKSSTTGGAVIVAYQGEVVYTHYYGWADAKRRVPVTENTFFRTASVTKMISGIGAMQLVEQGKLGLDKSIGDALGYKVTNPRYPAQKITLRQLMSHTSGINENNGYNYIERTLSSLIGPENARANFTERKPGAEYVYSNFGAGTVGAMMEQVSGVSIDRYMKDNVFGPLGIDAGYKPCMVEAQENIANQYDPNGGLVNSAWKLLEEPYDDRANADTHYRVTVGALWMRAKDLMKLTLALCQDGTMDGVQLLQPETVHMMRADQSTIKGSSVTGDSPYGLFTSRVTNLMKGKTVYGHQGLSGGFICTAFYEPESDWAFVLMTNGCSQVRDDRIAVLTRRLVERTNKLLPPEWSAKKK